MNPSPLFNACHCEQGEAIYLFVVAELVLLLPEIVQEVLAQLTMKHIQFSNRCLENLP